MPWSGLDVPRESLPTSQLAQFWVLPPPPLLFLLSPRLGGMPYTPKVWAGHPPPFSAAEQAEIERRRRVLKCGRQLSDEQILTIMDPGPEETGKHETGPAETDKDKDERRQTRTKTEADKDEKSWTPLMWAAKGGHAPVVQTLLAGGADICCTSTNGSTALSIAKKYGHEKCVELLERAKKAGMVGDQKYSGKGSARQSKAGKTNNSLVNHKGKDGKTPAHAASENGHSDTLRIILNGGGDPSSKDEAACTPAHLAAMNGHDGCLAVLIDHGGDFRSKNQFGFTPLRLALRNRHVYCASFLRDAIAKVDD